MTSPNRIPLFQRLEIESQSHCNRTCWFCPRTYDRSGTYRDAAGTSVSRRMPTEKILDLLDQARALGFQGYAGFHHYSEPLLDTRNVMLAREARARGMRPRLVTNGDLLRRDDALLEEVKDAYDVVVVGLYDYKTRQELETARQYWRQRLAGVDNLSFSVIGFAGARSGESTAIPRALVPSDPRMAVPDFTFANAPCNRPLIRMVVRYDGAVCNCCEDTDGAFQLGNVFQQSLEALWFSERHVRVVEDLIAGHRERYALCRICPLPPSALPPAGGKIDILPRRYAGNLASASHAP